MDLTLLYEAILKISFPVIALMIGAEALLSYIRKDKVYSLGDTWGTLATVAGYQIIRKAFLLAVFAGALGFLENFALFSLSAEQPLTWILAFFLVDFFYYWDHRLGHEVNFIWAFHNIHHSSDHYNLAVASRLSWVEEVYRWIFLAPLVLIGIPLPLVLLTKLLHRLYQLPVHTQYVGKLGWLEYIFATPSQHRVHHGRNPQYLDKNYGGVLCVWDRLFGTFEPEVEPVEYGLVKQIETVNPLKIQVIGPQRLFAEMMQAKSLTGRLRYLLAKPGTDPRSLDPEGLDGSEKKALTVVNDDKGQEEFAEEFIEVWGTNPRIRL